MKTSYEVFLSYSKTDAAIADVVRAKLSDAGLSVFAFHKAKLRADSWQEQIREALVECSAMVLILTRANLISPNLAVEVGGAWVWKKPIYVLTQSVRRTEIPSFLRGSHIVPISKTPDVARSIRRSLRPMSREELTRLKDAYQEFSVSVDNLAVEPAELGKLTDKLNRNGSRRFTPERLLQELLRMRKRGDLPKITQSRAGRRARAG